ncbi:MAG TPA: endonuclease/exonuclease/phosphatase family protein [Anaerolineaceae bacterium]|nr:endonuclease/exonuclease/phosphatase family protein [Anaerolineaceae bacterium]
MLKILTLNVNADHDKHGAWTDRRELIRDLVAVNAPDIIALQAVRRRSSGANQLDQAAQLAEHLPGGLKALFAPAGSENGAQDGPALLSSLPVGDSDTFPLTLTPDLDDSTRRLVLYARFDLPSGFSLRLFNAHFSWVTAQAGQNVQQAVYFMNQFPSPRILVGDLNQPPEADVLAPLREAGWTDAWAQVRQGQPGYTFEAGNWWTRIDYAWLDWELSQRLADVAVVGSQPAADEVTYPSNHAGLLVSLDVER